MPLSRGAKWPPCPSWPTAILNYLRLATTKNLGGSPVEVAYSSLSTQLCALGWIASVLWSLKVSIW